jgi:hypothetical protein
VLPSIPVAHVFGIIESDDSMKQLLQYLKYDTYKWNICVDLKVIALLLGLQLGYTAEIVGSNPPRGLDVRLL